MRCASGLMVGAALLAGSACGAASEALNVDSGASAPDAGHSAQSTASPSSQAAQPPTPDPRPSAPSDEPPPSAFPQATVPTTAAPTSDWRLIGYDEGSTYYNRAETTLDRDTVGKLQVAWRADIGGALYGAPLQVADKIFVAGLYDVRAFDAATGGEIWSLKEKSISTPAYVDGTLYLNTSTSTVIAIDASTGGVKWRSSADDQKVDGYSSVVAAGDRLFVGGSNGGVELGGGHFLGFMAALDRGSGKSLWASYTVSDPASGAGIFSSPSIDLAAGRVFGTTANNFDVPATDTSDAFIAFDIESGKIIWKHQAVANDTFPGNPSSPDFNFGANPVLYEADVEGARTELVVAGEKSGAIHALRRADGTLLWSRKLGPGLGDGTLGIMNNTTWSGKHVLVACNEQGPSTLYALAPATGDIAWQRKLKGSVWGRISVANGVGFVGNGEVLEAFDIDSGALIASFPSAGGTLAGVITIANGRVAFGEGLEWGTAKVGKTLTVLSVP